MVLSEADRITLLMMRGYGDRIRSYAEVAALFNDVTGSSHPISKSTVRKTVQRFHETGGVKDRPRCGRPKSATNYENSLHVMQTVVENPHSTLRKMEQALDISARSVKRILNENKYHPYKIHLTHQLMEDDADRRNEFCEQMMQFYSRDNTFFNRIIFSDEATFHLTGEVNRHNCRYWSDENPHWMRQLHTQYPQKINLWAGFCVRGIIGPFLIDGNLNGEQYLQLLQNNIVPAIHNLFNGNVNNIWFQQDGAGPHYAVEVRDYLDATFPNRWIGRRGEIEWPARSPDLSPMDYFLWGFLKNRVYETQPATLTELQQRISDQVAIITQEIRENVLNNFYFRLAHCQEALGEQFEHLLS